MKRWIILKLWPDEAKNDRLITIPPQSERREHPSVSPSRIGGHQHAFKDDLGGCGQFGIVGGVVRRAGP
jgi:hypothetical protein